MEAFHKLEGKEETIAKAILPAAPRIRPNRLGSPHLSQSRFDTPRGATTTGPDVTPPPSYLSKLAGGGGGSAGGSGGYWQLGWGGGGCAQPTTITCIPQGGV